MHRHAGPFCYVFCEITRNTEKIACQVSIATNIRGLSSITVSRCLEKSKILLIAFMYILD